MRRTFIRSIAMACPTRTIPNLRASVQQTYDRALASNDLTFTQPEYHHFTERGVKYQVLFCPQLLKKPNPHEDATPKPKIDPFLPPQEGLYIAPVGNTHFLCLNKFPVIRDHFILATTAFEPQTGVLSLEDWDAVAQVLNSWPREEGVYGFFNCGEFSGASQPHRHLQFLPMSREEEEALWGTKTVQGDGEVSEVKKCEEVPFEHFTMKLWEGGITGVDLRHVYLNLLELSEGVVGSKPISYNLGFSRRFMTMAPRTEERIWPVKRGTVVEGTDVTVPGIDPNGTILAGMLMAKTRIEMEAVRNGSIHGLLANIGIARSKERL